MHFIIEKANDLKELSLFLSQINNEKCSHIGFCGNKANEIYETLKEDFIDEDGNITFLIARNSVGNIIAAIGVDIDETVAEVWGPFNQTDDEKLQKQLWEQIVNENPTVTNYYFFINKENTKQQLFMDVINAKNTGEHLSLQLKTENFNKVKEMKSIPYMESDFSAFEQLHDGLFPNTYYDAKTIIERLGDGNILKLLKNKANDLLGYAYFEVDVEMEEASLEYIGISPEVQNQGLGTLLLKEILTEIFSFPQIEEIQLTVDNPNNQAKNVYMRAGFEQKHRLISYVLNR